jgi:hypothetical protein
MADLGQSDATDERDRVAEGWLLAQHTPDWYIGDANETDWKAAYAAADDLLATWGDDNAE